MKKLLYIISVVGLVSCGTTKPYLKKEVIQRNDTVIIKEYSTVKQDKLQIQYLKDSVRFSTKYNYQTIVDTTKIIKENESKVAIQKEELRLEPLKNLINHTLLYLFLSIVVLLVLNRIFTKKQ